MVVEIAEPDYELRLAILGRKAQATGAEVSNRILEVIAQNVNGNIRELEGALQAVALFNQMKKDGELSDDEVKRIIGVDSKSKREKVKVPGVIKKAAATFNVTAKDIKGPRRTKDVALARQVCMYILREEFNYKLEDIAKFLNREDHTTVIHAVDKTKSLMMKDDGFKDQVVSIIRDLYEGVDSD
jgi:chromosomal replication initiator protein